MSICEWFSVLISPFIACVIFVFLKYKYPKGWFSLVFSSFFTGAAGVILVFITDRIIEMYNLNSLHSVNRTLFYAFVLTTGIYELYKITVVRLLVYKSGIVRRPSDLIIYTLFIFTGFNSSFSLYRIYFGAEYVNDCIYAYSVGLVVLSLAVVMGYFIGQARGKQYEFVDFFIALFISTVFHGLYYFCILTSDLPLLYLSIAGMAMVASILVAIILKQKDDLYEPENFTR